MWPKPAQVAPLQAPPEMRRVRPTPRAWEKLMAPAKPLLRQYASAAGFPHEADHCRHQSSRAPPSRGLEKVRVSACAADANATSAEALSKICLMSPSQDD